MSEKIEFVVAEEAEAEADKIARDAAEGHKVPLWVLEMLQEQFENRLEERCPEEFETVQLLILLTEAITQLRMAGAMDEIVAACIGQELFNVMAKVPQYE
ncbi:MAG: hypothetical protein HPY85_06865 [Anaerolineae bacterium]|nr:hypothetical protein [Anaerolineae bacterium]